MLLIFGMHNLPIIQEGKEITNILKHGPWCNLISNT